MFKMIFSWCLTWCFVSFSSRLLKIFTRIVTHFLRPQRITQANVKLSTKWELISTWLPPDLIDISTDSHHMLLLLYCEWSIDSAWDLFLYFFLFSACLLSRRKKNCFKIYWREEMLNIMLDDAFLKSCVLHARACSFLRERSLGILWESVIKLRLIYHHTSKQYKYCERY